MGQKVGDVVRQNVRPKTADAVARPCLGNNIPSALCKEASEHGNRQTALAVIEASPFIGSKSISAALEPQLDGAFSKFFVLVVDVAHARKIGPTENKTLAEINEEVLEALGFGVPTHQKLQSVFATYDTTQGYNVPQRVLIETNEDLRRYYSIFGDGQNAATDDEQATTGDEEPLDPEIAQVAKELTDLRLGGIITKTQMRRYLQQLALAWGENKSLRQQVDSLKQALAAVEESTADRVANASAEAAAEAVEVALERAGMETTLKLQKQKQDFAQQMKAMELEAEEKMNELEATAVMLKNRLAKTTSQMEDAMRAKDTLLKEVATHVSENAMRRTQISDLKKEKKEREAKVAELEEAKEELEKENRKAVQALKLHGMSCEEVEDENGGETGSSETYCLVVKNMESKFKWEPDRVVLGPDVPFGDLENVQLEFCPGGVSSSFEGWSALRLRVPNAVRVHWQILVGAVNPVVLPARMDDFHDSFWWCRNGVVWQNFCRHDILREKLDSLGSLALQLKILHVAPLAEVTSPQTLEANMVCRPSFTNATTHTNARWQGTPVVRSGANTPTEHDRTKPSDQDKRKLYDLDWIKVLYQDEEIEDKTLSLFVEQYLNRRLPNPSSRLQRSPTASSLRRPASSPALRRAAPLSPGDPSRLNSRICSAVGDRKTIKDTHGNANLSVRLQDAHNNFFKNAANPFGRPACGLDVTTSTTWSNARESEPKHKATCTSPAPKTPNGSGRYDARAKMSGGFSASFKTSLQATRHDAQKITTHRQDQRPNGCDSVRPVSTTKAHRIKC